MSATSSSLSTSRVLVVDDDLTVRDVVRRYLERDGHEVFLADDGETALGLIGRCPPDLVVLDLMLPGVDGVEVYRRLRGFSTVPVVMLTARSHEEDRIGGLQLGADDYVTKPFSPAELALRVAAVLRRMRAANLQPATVEVADRHDTLDYANQLNREAQRLTVMVNDLFELSRISAGGLDLSMSQVPLAEVVDEALAAEHAVADRKHVRLQADTSHRPVVLGSDLELTRIVRNLVSNAVRHTPSEGTVRIVLGADTDADEAWLWVDTPAAGSPTRNCPECSRWLTGGLRHVPPTRSRPGAGWGWRSPGDWSRRTGAGSLFVITAPAAGSRCGGRRSRSTDE